MKNVPEIAPEIRALMQEVVDDPRSTIRLAPRRALFPWLESGDTLGHVSGTKAERHLVQAHRESLAQIFYEASKIAYWKAPVLSHRRISSDGSLYDPVAEEREWRTRAARKVESAPLSDGVELLRQCLEGVRQELGFQLARASLSLVMSDPVTIVLAGHLKRTEARASLRVFERLGTQSPSLEVRGAAWAGAGSRLCFLQDHAGAASAYARADSGWPCGSLYVLNLMLVMGREKEAREAAIIAADKWKQDSWGVSEAVRIITEWASSIDEGARRSARRTFAALSEGLPVTARTIGLVYE